MASLGLQARLGGHPNPSIGFTLEVSYTFLCMLFILTPSLFSTPWGENSRNMFCLLTAITVVRILCLSHAIQLR